jgi:hypothetical protein
MAHQVWKSNRNLVLDRLRGLPFDWDVVLIAGSSTCPEPRFIAIEFHRELTPRTCLTQAARFFEVKDVPRTNPQRLKTLLP